jgi:hypothetical protein
MATESDAITILKERAPNETWPIMPIFCVVVAGMCSIVTDALNMHRPISTVVH